MAVAITITIVDGAPLSPSLRHRNEFLHEEMVIPVPIIYNSDDSFENILNGGSYRLNEHIPDFADKKEVPLSTILDDDDEDDEDEEDDEESVLEIDDEEEAGEDNEGNDSDEDDDDDDTEDGDGSDDVYEEEDDDDEDEEKVESKRKRKSLLSSGINDSYGW